MFKMNDLEYFEKWIKRYVKKSYSNENKNRLRRCLEWMISYFLKSHFLGL